MLKPREKEGEGTSCCVMKPRVLSWNVRGLNEWSKRLRISNLLRDWKVDIICFQETKVQGMSRSFVRSLWGCNNVDWCCLDSCGASGSILIMWDKRVVENVDVCVGEFTLAASFRNVVDRFVLAFAGVYGPNSDFDRRLLWDELAGILSWWSMPRCTRGDFNVTRFPSERSREGSMSAMRNFSDFIFYQGLMNLPLTGGSYTWSFRLDPLIWSRIDRFLVSPYWEARFPVVSRKGFLASIQTTSRFFSIASSFLGGKGLSNLRTCGLKRMVLCRG
jgi:hypothetical protein